MSDAFGAATQQRSEETPFDEASTAPNTLTTTKLTSTTYQSEEPGNNQGDNGGGGLAKADKIAIVMGTVIPALTLLSTWAACVLRRNHIMKVSTNEGSTSRNASNRARAYVLDDL